MLLVTLDTTRADHLGCYGHDVATSPRLDAFAAEGVLFEHAIAQAAVTSVSHASILTGLNPYRHGLRVLHGNVEYALPEDRETLAERLRAAGYRTAAFVSAYPVSERFGLQQGFDTFDADFGWHLRDPLASDGTVNAGSVQRRADATTTRALAWLGEAPRPFFLWVHYFDPHDGSLLPPGDFTGLPPPAGEGVERLRALYDYEVAYMDEQFGRLLDVLAESGEETIAVVVADHGEGLGDHGWWTHGVLYQEQIRVPLLLRAPGVPAGRRVDRLVRSIDIVPTVLELAGVPYDAAALDGESLVSSWAVAAGGGAVDAERIAYSDSVNRLVYRQVPGYEDRKDDLLFALSDGRWKYVHHLLKPGQSELYDLASDPGESRNLLAERPEEAERLRAELERRPFLPERHLEEQEVPSEVVERLRALGYVHE